MNLSVDKANASDFVSLSSLLLGYMNWCLLEQFVAELGNDKSWFAEHRHKPDVIALFKAKVEQRTRAIWDHENIVLLYERVKLTTEKHFRKPITYAELLRLLINSPLQCADTSCGKKPPEVKLHIDHIFPSSRGGSSNYENLQFLCAECNLRKSNKLEKTEIWLKLKSLRRS
jgi:hypothetical protein